MSDDELIERISERVASRVLDALPGILESNARLPEWISQNRASKMVGRKRLETAKEKGIVAWQKKNFDSPRSRVYVKSSDVLKLVKKPF
jgi:hypothetical protein